MPLKLSPPSCCLHNWIELLLYKTISSVNSSWTLPILTSSGVNCYLSCLSSKSSLPATFPFVHIAHLIITVLTSTLYFVYPESCIGRTSVHRFFFLKCVCVCEWYIWYIWHGSSLFIIPLVQVSCLLLSNFLCKWDHEYS